MSEGNQIVEFMEKARPKFELAPEGMHFEQEQGYAMQLFAKNPYLEKVASGNPRSLLSAMGNVASVGLSLNPAKAQAYLIPRNIRIDGQNVAMVCFDPSYRGLCDIATGIGCVSWIQSDVVRKEDVFTLRGVSQEPLHERDPFKTAKERGPITGAYCVAKTPDGDFLTTTMSLEELYKVRDKSEMWKRNQAGPWKDWEEEQMKKTVVRRAYKMWPKSKDFSRLSEAVNISNENEGHAPIVNNPEISQALPTQKEYFDKLISNSDSVGMFCFMASLESGVQTDLYNSFDPKSRQVVKYKKLVDDLLASGRSRMEDYKTVIEDATESGDDLAAKELIEDLAQEGIDYLLANVSDDAAAFVRECQKEVAA